MSAGVTRGATLVLAVTLLAFLPVSSSAQTPCTSVATGGTVSVITDGGDDYCLHVFEGDGTFDAPSSLTVEYLIVGGGGSGGSAGPYGGGGGGGAGGLLTGSESLTAGSYSIVVGTGGASTSGAHTPGNEGENSSAFGETAIGGGRGGSGNNGGPTAGGSGGGQGAIANSVEYPGDVSGTSGQGNDGGLAIPPNGGGGGGAGAPGGTPPDAATAANGGDGLQSSITGSQVYYAGGGAGSGPTRTGNGVTAINPPRGIGGLGGGGGEGSIDGVDGTGGGGAAGLSENGTRSGAGGDGIVIVRYAIPAPLPAADAGPDQSVSSGASVTLDGSDSTAAGDISYSWSQTGVPSVTVTGANTATPSFEPILSPCASDVSLTFALVVSDDFNREATDTVTVTVTAPSCPPGGGIGGSEVNEYNDPNGEVTWRAHSFFDDDTLTLSEATDVEYLIVGGGGGGGNAGATHYTGGGGGAGGVLQSTFSGLSGSFPITVGDGGTGGVNSDNNGLGESGQDSSFNGETAEGGGGGGGAFCDPGCTVSAPSPGGSGGGGGAQIVARARPGAAGTADQGNDGGDGHGSDVTGADQTAGGGGGAGGAGGNGTPDTAGAGGAGIESSITGASQSYAGGGGGGKREANGTAGTATHGGGSGGGGNGEPLPGNGAPNTGGGGGGAGAGRDSGGAGGSGIVVARYVINTRPTADAGTDENAVAFEQFTLDGAGTTDPDDNITSYEWEQIAGTTMDLSDTSAISPTFTPEQPANGAASETLTFRLTVTDDFGLSHTDEVTITLQAVAVLQASKTVSIFSEDGSDCDDFNATAPTEPALPAAIPGACIEYTITITNSGPVAATNVGLVDELPETVTAQVTSLSGWANTPTEDLSCSAGGCTLTITNGEIAANQAATVKIRATID